MKAKKRTTKVVKKESVAAKTRKAVTSYETMMRNLKKDFKKAQSTLKKLYKLDNMTFSAKENSSWLKKQADKIQKMEKGLTLAEPKPKVYNAKEVMKKISKLAKEAMGSDKKAKKKVSAKKKVAAKKKPVAKKAVKKVVKKVAAKKKPVAKKAVKKTVKKVAAKKKPVAKKAVKKVVKKVAAKKKPVAKKAVKKVAAKKKK